jgi:thiamine-monophosphate kinase
VKPRPYILLSVAIPEKNLIARIRQLAKGRANSTVMTGIGDDCAVLRPGGRSGGGVDTLVTTDFSLEGVHFRRDWHTPESVGHRCLARGLSDIAAMGGEPVAAFLSLALPHRLPRDWVKRFSSALLGLASQYGVTLAGGDTAESPGGILADIVVLGTAPKGKAILRSGAQAGDGIYVTGALGGSAAVVGLMRKTKRKLDPQYYPRHFFPEPRIAVGRLLREKSLASAMIDTSDGLSTDMAHICEESGVGAEVRAESIPLAAVGRLAREIDLELALHGGEDYELLFTAPQSKEVPPQIAGVPITKIGRITRGAGMFLEKDGKRSELKAGGWEHFVIRRT